MVVQSVEVTRGRFSWDTIGVGASTLCLVHCVLTPIALAFAPVLSEFLPGDTFVHRVIIVVVVAIGLFAFVPGYRKHRKWIVFLPMVVGVWAIGLGRLAAHSWVLWQKSAPPFWEAPLSLQLTASTEHFVSTVTPAPRTVTLRGVVTEGMGYVSADGQPVGFHF